MASVDPEKATRKKNVLQSIKDRIQFLTFKPGERINEKALAEEFRVSRTPVREALILLSDEKLVDIYPQSGTFVSKIKLSMVVELVYMRHILEVRILNNLCAKRARVYDAVAKCLALQEAALGKRDVLDFMRHDDAFHQTLFGLAGAFEIWRIISTTRAHHTRFRVLDLGLPKMLQASFGEHRRMVDFIQGGKSRELRRVLTVHHDIGLMNKNIIVPKYEDYFI
ncbi:MAG: GntR family transcriptional regulator [Planctomycetota bacterium]|nr:GntR family transcriptional regulator [Planctomycetota bacterium]